LFQVDCMRMKFTHSDNAGTIERLNKGLLVSGVGVMQVEKIAAG